MYSCTQLLHTTKRIRVADRTHAALEAPTGADEPFDDLRSRLVRERRALVREGAGLWAGTDAATTASDTREQLNQDLGGR